MKIYDLQYQIQALQVYKQAPIMHVSESMLLSFASHHTHI